MELIIKTANKDETQKIGKILSIYFQPGDVVLLTGDLGAGKTTFTNGVGNGLGLKEEVISPTFNIMKCYFNGKLPLYHIDAYRLENQNLELGLDEYIEGDGVCLIEWPMYIESLLPDERLEIKISNLGSNDRELKLISNSAHYDDMLNRLKEELYD